MEIIRVRVTKHNLIRPNRNSVIAVPAKDQTSVTYPTAAGNRVKLQFLSTNLFHIIIFKAIKAALEGDWFDSLTVKSQTSTGLLIRPFITWLNNKDSARTETTRYECLTDYDQYRRNEHGVSHSYADRILTILRQGLTNGHFSNAERVYLETLVKLTKVAPSRPARSLTLTNWFADHNIRQLLEEKDFLRLESPSRLLLSFRVVVGSTLLLLLEARATLADRLSVEYNNPSLLRSRENCRHILINKVGSFDSEGRPADLLTALIMADFIDDSRLEAWRLKFIQKGSPPSIGRNKEQNYYRSPSIFTPNYFENFSRLEETLASWLCACETVQPSDIPKLRSSDYAIEYDSKGRLLMMQLKYYKGRSGAMKETAVLMGSDCWTTAQHRYIEDLPSEGLLFNSLVGANGGPRYYGSNNICRILLKIWQLPHVSEKLESDIQIANTSSLFIKAFQAVMAAQNSNGITPEEKDSLIPFRLTHVKNTAVHAGSDRYRDSDLINHHSHTSTTEKYYYLTDQNKDWVNQCGRITRLVLHDLQIVAFRPSIDLARRNIEDAELKTKVVSTTQTSSAAIYSILPTIPEIEDSDAEIVVHDTLDSAIYLFHYLAQAEAMYHKIIQRRPDYVEKTMLIQIEWSTRTLAKMRSAKKAKETYDQIKKFLPPSFDFLLGE